MAKALAYRLEKAAKRMWVHGEQLGNVAISLGGVALALTFIVITLTLTDGASVVLKNAFVFAMTLVSGTFAALGLILADRTSSDYKKRVARIINIIAGAPMWYIIAGVTYALSIIH